MNALAEALRAVCADLERHEPSAPSLHFAKGVLAAGVAPVATDAPAAEMIDLAAKAFSLAREDILSPSRKAEIAEARFAVMLAMRRNGVSLPQIGRALNRDRTSVLHGLRRAEALEQEAPAFARAVAAISAGDVPEPIVPTAPLCPPRRKHDMAAIAKAYADGASLLECASQFEASIPTIKRALRMHGVEVRNKGSRPGHIDKRLAARLEEIMAMRANGATGIEIGRHFGITRERVRQIVLKAGLMDQFAERPLTPEQKAICREYADGACLKAVAEKLGVSEPTARGWITREGIKIRPNGRVVAARKRRRELAVKVAGRYLEGADPDAISREFGFKNNAQIYGFLAIAGVKPNRRDQSWRGQA